MLGNKARIRLGYSDSQGTVHCRSMKGTLYSTLDTRPGTAFLYCEKANLGIINYNIYIFLKVYLTFLLCTVSI